MAGELVVEARPSSAKYIVLITISVFLLGGALGIVVSRVEDAVVIAATYILISLLTVSVVFMGVNELIRDWFEAATVIEKERGRR